jgi:hypothetical protein
LNLYFLNLPREKTVEADQDGIQEKFLTAFFGFSELGPTGMTYLTGIPHTRPATAVSRNW